MSWKIALAVALLSAVITALVTAPVAYKVAGLHGMSDFEGKRAYMVLLLFIPAGLVAGFLLGLLGTKLVGAVAWAQIWKAAGVSVAMGQVVLWGIAGLSLLAVPRPVQVGGRLLAVEVEVRVPQRMLTPRSREAGAIRMSLYAGERDNQGVTVDTARYRHEGGDLVVVASAPLLSHSPTRILSFHLEDSWLAFDLPLAARPKPDGLWSGPAPMRDAMTSGATTRLSPVLLRYRVLALTSVP